MKSFSWILLGVTTLACAYGGLQLVSKMNAISSPMPALSPTLAILGVITAGMGAKGYFQARSNKTTTGLVYSLSLVIGALALLMALYFLLP